MFILFLEVDYNILSSFYPHNSPVGWLKLRVCVTGPQSLSMAKFYTFSLATGDMVAFSQNSVVKS